MTLEALRPAGEKEAFMKRLGVFLILSSFAAAPKAPLPASEITVPPGFKVEMVRAAEPEEGSWVAICKDNKGRLIISPQDGQPLLRLTLCAIWIRGMITARCIKRSLELNRRKSKDEG